MLPHYRAVITKTWLSKAPDSWGFIVTGFMILLMTIASVAYWNDWFQLSQWLPASFQTTYQNSHYWQSITALFIHGDEKHLISNSFLFFILGGFLAGHFGYFLFPTLAFLMGALTNLIVLLSMRPETRLLGASGIVFWMGGAWLMLYFLIDIKRSLYQRSLRALGVALMLFFPAEAFDVQISYRSHFLGFILGVLSGAIFYYFQKEKFSSALEYQYVFEEPENFINDESDRSPVSTP